MGFRFRKRINLFPGLKLNLSKSGASLSAGLKGLMFNFGKKGARVTVDLPGTGVSWVGRLFGQRNGK